MVDLTRWRRRAEGWAGALGDLVYPQDCAVCDAGPIRGAVCGDCRAELIAAAGPACPRCALPLGPYEHVDRGCARCRGCSLGFDAAVALGPYQGPIRHLCLRLKHERDAWLARWLMDLVVEARADVLRAAAEDAAAVVPVPLHWWRGWRRGYNQADALAERLARRLRKPLARPLRRVRWTEKLADLSRTEREEMMRDAFRCGRRARLRGRTVLLVDDILTTGATCRFAARALKQAGAKRVVAVVVARAEGLV